MTEQAKLNFEKSTAPKRAKKTAAVSQPHWTTKAPTVDAFRAYSRRSWGLFRPGDRQPYRLSRSRLENYTRCARCFYLDRRLGVDQPAGYPFTLNSAVDHLLKKEFDIHRAKRKAHPLMKAYKVNAIPFSHPKLEEWRNNRVGVQYLHKPTNFLVTGAVDDVWVNPKGELIVVDYKATAKDGEVGLDADWQDGYKRQMEIYQWLLRQNNFEVSGTGYFVYANGKKDVAAFDGKLEFDLALIPYTGDDSWVEGTLIRAKQLLENNALPPADTNCEYCAYRREAARVEHDAS